MCFHKDKLVDRANVIFLSFDTDWHQLYFDCGIIFWRPQKGPPEGFSAADLGCTYPLLDLGRHCGVKGQKLCSCASFPVKNGFMVSFKFESGAELSFRCTGDTVNYEFSPPPTDNGASVLPL